MLRDTCREMSRVSRLQENVTGLLFARTMVILTGLLVLWGAASWWARDWVPSTGGWIFFSCTALVLVIVTALVAKDDNAGAMIPAGFMALNMGLLAGPALTVYVEKLGPGTVTAAIVITTGVMAGCGLIASLFTIPYRKIEGPLLVALFGLLIWGCVMCFTGIPSGTVNLTYAGAGMIIFTLYFLIDFARLYDRQGYGATGWGEATLHAVGLFLDWLNFLMFLLRAWAESRR